MKRTRGNEADGASQISRTSSAVGLDSDDEDFEKELVLIDR